MTAALETEDVSFAYPGGGPQVLRNVSLALAPGCMAAVIGSNGSGKSTLIKLCAGILTPSAGRLRYGGIPRTRQSARDLARRIAYVPQAAPVNFPFTALEIVLTGRSPYNPRFQFETPEDVARAQAALEAADAAHLAARPVTELSGGERQLVFFARALAQDPECLLLDEPSSSLDLKHRATLLRAIRDLRQTRPLTVLMVTHDLPLIDSSVDRVFALRCGGLFAAGPPAEILSSAVLRDVFGDPGVRTERHAGRTFVWSEV